PAEVASNPELLNRVRDEVADVAIYAILFADVLGFDLGEAIRGKLEKNAEKYPVDKARGRAAKWDRL
ncbi:MAG TPA: MazG-like family protein, partial [Burkholderiales bacterium]|nr:MazG-like family protein [Burkholderiales bacterium]